MTPPTLTVTALTRFANFAIVILVTAVLYLARDVLVPIALALLLSFVLAPLVRWLERRGLGRVVAMLVVVVTLFGFIGGIGWITTSQLVDLANSLPEYRENLHDKLAILKGNGATRPLSNVMDEFGKLFSAEEEGAGSALPGSPVEGVPRNGRPIPVTVVDSTPPALGILRSLLGPLLNPLATAGIVLVFVLFMLLAWESLSDRLLRLTGSDQLGVTTHVIDDAARRVSHYLLMQFVVNASIGLVIGLGLYFLGVPNAALWGLLSTVLRYIPFVGGIIASLLPIAVSVITSPGWTQALLIVGLIVVVEMISNNVVEPWLYGHNTGISSIGILAAAIFWGWLWGGVGLILATPLTVCLVVMSRHFPQLGFIHVLVGQEEALSPAERLYQRLLTIDAEGGAKVIDRHDHRGVRELYDSLITPTLELVERDRQHQTLTPDKERFVYENLKRFIEVARAESTTSAVTTGKVGSVLCIPARGEADELLALMCALALESEGQRALPLAVTPILSDTIGEVALQEVEVVCVTALYPFSLAAASELCQKLRAHYPRLRIVAGAWGLPADAAALREQLATAGANEVATSLAQMIEQVRSKDEVPNPDAIAEALGRALLAYDANEAETLLAKALRAYPLDSVCVETIQPTLFMVGKGWEEGKVSIEQEHFTTNFFRGKLLHFVDSLPLSQTDAPRAIACCAPEEQHEIGLVMLTLLLRQRGWKVVYLGQRVPSEGLTEAVARVQPQVLLFSATLPQSAEWLGRVADLTTTFEDPPHIVFGGQALAADPTLASRLPGTVFTGDARAAVDYLDRLARPEVAATEPSAPLGLLRP